MIFLLIGNSCTLSALSPRHLLQIKFQKMILFYYEGDFKGNFTNQIYLKLYLYKLLKIKFNLINLNMRDST